MPAKSPSLKATKVALAKIEGKSDAEACREAGYASSTVLAKSYEIVKSDPVREELIRLGRGVALDELGELAKGRLVQILSDPEIQVRDAITAIRAALETSGRIGSGRVQEHMHQHELSPETRALLAASVVEIQEKKNAGSHAREAPEDQEGPERIQAPQTAI